jgi:hypothetical protein
MRLKTMRTALTVGLVVGVAVLLIPGRAVAQARQSEISGGWSYAHEAGVSIPGGWYASIGRYVNNWFGIVGEVNGHYKTTTESGVDTKRNFHIFGAGARFAYRKYPRFTPFVDLIAGGRHGSALNDAATEINASVTDFAYESNWGLGINNTTGSLGVRVSVGDYGARSASKWTNDTLFEAGVVIRR